MIPPLPEPLHTAWTATRYMFAARGVLFEARIGQVSASISKFLTEHNATAGIFLSAFNPGLPAAGTVSDEMYPLLQPEENAALLEQLWSLLGTSGVRWFPHVGLPDSTDWPPEEGAFILEEAGFDPQRLARSFRQRAYVRVARNQPATLELVAPATA
ncbi:MAG: DUF3293 domain-containing protein [Elstera sp.]|jgi:hypothetical protein|uniref:DUF3293 domain-containing protein n=1 Tax=Elstera sp. TaxID=1916664 RepID=UPI0037BE2914